VKLSALAVDWRIHSGFSFAGIGIVIRRSSLWEEVHLQIGRSEGDLGVWLRFQFLLARVRNWGVYLGLGAPSFTLLRVGYRSCVYLSPYM
jgi:hypothetical protein